MKNQLYILILFFALSVSAHARTANDLCETRTVIDSAKAIVEINAKIAEGNAPVERDIERLLDEMKHNSIRHKLAEDTLAVVERLRDLCMPKLKDKALAAEFAVFYEAELNKLPQEKLLTLAKEKDVAKARDKDNADEEIAGLIQKIKTRQIKDVMRGHLYKTIVAELIDSTCNHLAVRISSLDCRLRSESDSVAGLRSRLEPLSESFELNDYLSRFDMASLPLKQIDVSLANAPATYHSFAYYAEKYPYCLGIYAEGRFDGIISDRIYAFPLESSIEPYGDDMFVARRLVLKSEKGSVPECIAGNPGDESLYVWVGAGVDSMTALHDVWEKGGGKREGIFISTSHAESTVSNDLTYVLDGGKWVNRAPFNPAYLTYDDCQRLIPENIMSEEPLHFNWNDELLGQQTCKLIFVRSNDGNKVYVKSKPVNADLVVDGYGLKLKGWKSCPDMFGPGNDGLILFYDNPNERGGEIQRVYSLSWGGPSGTTLNGAYTENGEGWLDNTP